MKFRALFRIFDNSGTSQDVASVVQAGQFNEVELVTPFLVSAGQTIRVSFAVAPVRNEEEPPPERGLLEVVREVIKHQEDHPSHGINCSCMDSRIWEIRRMIMPLVPDFPEDDAEYNQTYRDISDTRARVKYVITAALRTL